MCVCVCVCVSLVAQWFKLHASTAGGTGSISGQGTKIQQVLLKKKTPWTPDPYLKAPDPYLISQSPPPSPQSLSSEDPA